MERYVDPLSLAALSLYLLNFLIDLVCLALRREAFPFGKIIILSGALLHLGALTARSLYVGHAPMANLYETLLFFSFCVALSAFVYALRYPVRRIELIALPVASALLVAALRADHAFTPLYIALKTRWFEVHVMASFAGYALFTIAFSSGFFYLLTAGKDQAAARVYEEITNSANIWGFSLFSFAMYSGAIWAYIAWGNYWFWEPKTIWSFILWFYFAGIIHGHYLKGWRGRRVAVMTIVGFVVVLFTYMGVGMLMKSSHNL